MANKIQHKRGLKANLPTLNVAEMGFATDTKELFVGSASGNVQLAKQEDLTTQGNAKEPLLSTAATKTTPVDADAIILTDSAASNKTKRTLWSNVKATLKTYFDTLYNNYTHPTGDGNLHVPVTGTANSGKVLKAGSTAGSLSWGTLAKADVGLGSVDNVLQATKAEFNAHLADYATNGAKRNQSNSFNGPQTFNDVVNAPVIIQSAPMPVNALVDNLHNVAVRTTLNENGYHVQRVNTGDILGGWVNNLLFISLDGSVVLDGLNRPLAATESGTWTPVIAGSTTTGSNAYFVQGGVYLKTNKSVKAEFFIHMKTKDASMLGAIAILGIPFISKSITSGAAYSVLGNIKFPAGYTQITGRATTDSVGVQLYFSGNDAAFKEITDSNITNDTYIEGSITYLTN